MLTSNNEHYKAISYLLGKIRKSEDDSGRPNYSEGSRDIAQVTARVLSVAVNDYCFNSRAFSEEFKSLHKTLQQNIVREFLNLINSLDEQNDSIDDRNAGIYKVAKAMKEAGITDIGLPMI